MNLPALRLIVSLLAVAGSISGGKTGWVEKSQGTLKVVNLRAEYKDADDVEAFLRSGRAGARRADL